MPDALASRVLLPALDPASLSFDVDFRGGVAGDRASLVEKRS